MRGRVRQGPQHSGLGRIRPRASSSKWEGGAVSGLHILRLRAAFGWQTQVQGLDRIHLAAWRVQVLVNVPHANVDLPGLGPQHLQWRKAAGWAGMRRQAGAVRSRATGD